MSALLEFFPEKKTVKSFELVYSQARILLANESREGSGIDHVECVVGEHEINDPCAGAARGRRREERTAEGVTSRRQQAQHQNTRKKRNFWQTVCSRTYYHHVDDSKVTGIVIIKVSFLTFCITHF